MSLPARRASTALLLFGAALGDVADPPGVAEAPFLAETIAALPISDANCDLAAMMIVYHRSVITMAASIYRQHSPTKGT